MNMKDMQKQIDWLTKTLIKIAKDCNVNISNEIEEVNESIIIAEQAITEQDLLNIENGIALTELELMVLEMGC